MSEAPTVALVEHPGASIRMGGYRTFRPWTRKLGPVPLHHGGRIAQQLLRVDDLAVAFSEYLRRPLLRLVLLLIDWLGAFGRLLVHCRNITNVSEPSYGCSVGWTNSMSAMGRKET